MSRVAQKAVRIPISQILIPRDENYRDEDAYKLGAMKDDMAFQGQTTPTLLEKIGDNQYKPIQGFRRTTAISELAEAGIIDPTTGKPFDSVIGIVYEGLNEQERVRLKLDHGQRRGLNKAELQRACEDALRAGYSEKDIAIVMFGLLEQLYPPTRKIDANNPQAILEYYRGVIQTAKNAFRAPTVLHDAWMSKLRGDHKWPTVGELRKFVDIFTKECDKHPEYNRQNPGPEFQKEWQAFMDKVNEANANGESRPKATNMMNNSQVTEAIKGVDSVTVKAAYNIILRKIGQDKLAVLDKLCLELETANPTFKESVLKLFTDESITTDEKKSE